MKRLILLFMSALILFGCASSTVIKTIPNGVKIKQGSEMKGVTPYDYWDRSPSFAIQKFTLQKDGYKDKEITITKDSFYVSRIFFPPVLAWPWMFGYQDSYFFELEKSDASGCTGLPLYPCWGKQLTEMPNNNARVEDVSMLLGVPPKRCESVESKQLLIGVLFDSEKAVVKSVTPNSPAHHAGIRAGDSIISINGQSVVNSAQIREALQTYAREGQPLNIVTNRSTLVVVPKLPKAEQCYWELQEGQVARTGGSAYVDQWRGTASSGGSAHQQFFRASCRIHDGFLAECSANWQE